MILFINAKVNYIFYRNLEIQTAEKGYSVLIARPSDYAINEIQKIYIYKISQAGFNNTSFIEQFYGFKTKTELELFKKLLSVSGIGTKTAMQIMENDAELINELISNSNYERLEMLPHIRPSLAAKICKELGPVAKQNYFSYSAQEAKAIAALKNLGYSKQQISYALSQIDKNLDSSSFIQASIKLISQLSNKNSSETNAS